MDSITFRTDDPTRWGTGAGADLTASQIDINFWVLYTAIVALQDHADTSAGIDYFTVTGDQFTVMLTNHVALGPFTLPVASFNFRDEWQAYQTYNINDVFTYEGAVYLVIWPVTNSGETFIAGANDGEGHNYYAVLLAAPPDELPNGATAGQVLSWSDGISPAGPAWINQTRNIAIYMETPPDALEEVLIYLCPETMTFPDGLTGSLAWSATAPTVDQVYTIYQNDVNIGSINFFPSPDTPSFTFPHAITFAPGDILSIFAPASPDSPMTKIAITLVATLP